MQIGTAIQLYAHGNGGAFPPDLATVLVTQNIAPDVFVCDHGSESPVRGRTIQQRAAQLLHGHCSYIYVGQHFTTTTNPECVLAFEDPANHDLGGSNVLFVDGHVEFLSLGYVAAFISELEQGYSPPRQIAQTLQQAHVIYQRDWVPKLQSIKSGQWSAFLPATRPTSQSTK